LLCRTAYRTATFRFWTGLTVEETGEQVNSGTGYFMASSFEMTRRVEFCETDMAGIVHFSNFYKWMEQAEHEFFRTQGLSIVRHLPDGSTIGWPRVSAQCRFESPARYEDILTVILTVQRIGMKSLTFDVVFRNGDRNIARGSMKTVCCVLRPGHGLESLEIPDEYRSRFEEHPEEQTGT
jgi:YbgC/YbaW family acyl-CoA thioester hydrolase